MTGPAPVSWQDQPLDAEPSGHLNDIWSKAVRALHSGRPEVTRDVLDGYVQEQTGGQIRSFQDLARARMRQQNVAGGQRTAAAGMPSPLATGAESFANAMALGLPRKAGIAEDFMSRGGEANPWSDFIGETAGSMVPAAVTGELSAGPANALAARLPLPALLKLGAAGGLKGAAAAATAEYGQSPDFTPHPGELSKAAGVGFAGGAPLGILGGWAATKLNPTEHLAGRAIQESTPSETPSFGAGVEALKSGAVTPMRVGPPSAGVTFNPMSESAAQQLPEELRPMNFEKSPALRALAAKGITQSAQASADAEHVLNGRVSKLVTTRRAIENHPTEGYNAILAKPLAPAEVSQLPASTQQTLGPTPTARDVFEHMRDLRDRSSAAFKMRDQGTGIPDLRLARTQQAESGALRDWLGQNVLGFEELQQKIAPYLQREDELRMAKRQLIGRAVKPLGKTAKAPAGKIEEGMKESLGYEKGQITERVSRQLVQPLLSTDLNDFLNFVTQKPEVAQKVPALLRALPSGAGAATGSAGVQLQTNRLRSLLHLVNPAQ